MKIQDIRTLHGKTVAELQQQLRELKNQHQKTRLKAVAGKLADVRTPSKLADDLARVQTVLTQKQLLAAVQTELAAQQEQK